MPCPPSLHHLQSRCKEQRVFWQRELQVEKQQRQNYERNNTEKQQAKIMSTTTSLARSTDKRHRRLQQLAIVEKNNNF